MIAISFVIQFVLFSVSLKGIHKYKYLKEKDTNLAFLHKLLLFSQIVQLIIYSYMVVNYVNPLFLNDHIPINDYTSIMNYRYLNWFISYNILIYCDLKLIDDNFKNNNGNIFLINIIFTYILYLNYHIENEYPINKNIGYYYVVINLYKIYIIYLSDNYKYKNMLNTQNIFYHFIYNVTVLTIKIIYMIY